MLQDFSEPEPDPWSVPMPMPIIGYILSCAHGHCNMSPDDVSERINALPGPGSCPSGQCQQGGGGDLQRYRSLSDTKLHKLNKFVPK
jgi:hypothetical protein